MSDTPQVNARIYIRVVPSVEEDDDMVTLSLVEGVRMDILAEVSQLNTYTAEQVTDHTRDGGLIVLAAKIAQGIVAQKDLIIQFFQTSRTAIDVLSKRGHVKAIEVTIDGNNIRIEDASDAQANRLISLFEAQYPGKVQQITSSSIMEVTGIVSKAERPAIPERTVTEKDG
jgi:hypothetical protein